MKKPIKVIKRSAEPVQQIVPVMIEIPSNRQIERDMRTAVNDWIEERRTQRRDPVGNR